MTPPHLLTLLRWRRWVRYSDCAKENRRLEKCMTLRFTVLASGSAGNASLVQADGFGVLLDAGLGPKQLAERLKEAGLSWANVHAMLLSHTHSDHWNDRTLEWFAKRGLPLYCHSGHH